MSRKMGLWHDKLQGYSALIDQDRYEIHTMSMGRKVGFRDIPFDLNHRAIRVRPSKYNYELKSRNIQVIDMDDLLDSFDSMDVDDIADTLIGILDDINTGDASDIE